jgi:hypothetical protein
LGKKSAGRICALWHSHERESGSLHHVKASDLGRSSATISVTSSELMLFNNALNEVCNGVLELGDNPEFEGRVGSTRFAARSLLAEVSTLLDSMGRLPR